MLERLDARVKLAMLLTLSTASVVTRDPLLLLALLAFTALVLIVGGVPPIDALHRVKTALKLIVSLFVLQCVFNRSGTPLLTLFGVTLVTHGGIDAAAYVALRLLIILLSALIVLTGSRRDYLLALNQLGLPYEISFMVMAGLRFLPLLRDEARDVMASTQMRGTKIRHTGLRHRLSVYISVSMPIVAGAIRRSEQMSVAMEARAFRSMPQRTSMRRLRMNGSDWAYLAVFFLVFAAIICGGILWLHQ